MFDWSVLQQMFGYGGQGLLQANPMQGYQGNPYQGQQQAQGMNPNMGNPYAMGIPTQPQGQQPYTQQSQYTGVSPYNKV